MSNDAPVIDLELQIGTIDELVDLRQRSGWGKYRYLVNSIVEKLRVLKEREFIKFAPPEGISKKDRTIMQTTVSAEIAKRGFKRRVRYSSSQNVLYIEPQNCRLKEVKKKVSP